MLTVGRIFISKKKDVHPTTVTTDNIHAPQVIPRRCWFNIQFVNEAVDVLGVVMVSHGEEFREGPPFGASSLYVATIFVPGHQCLVILGMSLVTLGRAHCKIMTFQEA